MLEAKANQDMYDKLAKFGIKINPKDAQEMERLKLEAVDQARIEYEIEMNRVVTGWINRLERNVPKCSQHCTSWRTHLLSF